MMPIVPAKLKATCIILEALAATSMLLRCYVRLYVVKSWGMDDSFIVAAFFAHLWFTTTVLTGIHYGSGMPKEDITVDDLVRAMRCWFLCFLAYATTVTLAKLSVGFFFLRISRVKPFYCAATYATMALSTVAGLIFFFVGLFQCRPVEFFWTRLAGKASGTCIDVGVIVNLTYAFGGVSILTDIAFSVMVFVLVWKLQIDRRTKILISPFLGMACVASYGAIVRMPFVKHLRSTDFLYSTVDISFWSAVEVGVAVFAANLATLRPLCRKLADISQSLSLRTTKPASKQAAVALNSEEVGIFRHARHASHSDVESIDISDLKLDSSWREGTQGSSSSSAQQYGV